MEIRLRDARLEICNVAELVLTEDVLDEHVVEMKKLVVRSDGDRMFSFDPSEVVGDLDDVLVELVRLRREFGTRAHGASVWQVDPHVRKMWKSRLVSAIEQVALIRHSELVELARPG